MTRRGENDTTGAQHIASLVIGVVLTVAGLLGDAFVGVMMLAGGSAWWLLAHLAAVPLWALGLVLLTARISPSLPAAAAERCGFTQGIRQCLNNRIAAMTIFSLALFPGMGVLGCTLAFLLFASASGRRDPRQSPQTFAEAETAHSLAQSPAWQAAATPDADLAVQPLVDVLDSTEVEQRRAAIDALGRQGHPEAVGMLRASLTDPSPDVRGDAAVALARLEHEYVLALTEAQAQMRTDLAASGHYAEVCYRYAHSGLLEDTINHYYLLQARDALERATAIEQAPVSHWLLLARIQTELDAPEAAIGALSHAMAHNERSTEAHLLHLEAALQRGDVGGMLALTAFDASELEAQSELGDLLAWWADAL